MNDQVSGGRRPSERSGLTVLLGDEVCMDTLLTDKRPVARKEYHCMASDWIRECGWEDGDWSTDEAAAIANAKRDGWKILKGTRYVYQTGLHDGDMVTFRARVDLHAICLRYNFYAA